MTMKLALILSFLWTSSLTAQQDSVSSCDVGLAVRAGEAKRVDDRMIRRLFQTGTDACIDNVEFMETFNETVFAVLDRSPAAFVRQFARIPHQRFILERLASPVNDAIDPARIARKMARSAAPRNASYKRIVGALREAVAKDHLAPGTS
jgi:hypothetical protein